MSEQFGTNSRRPHAPCPASAIRHLPFGPGRGAGRYGGLLGSLPLCEADLAAGRLVRLGDEVLQHHESYWAIAGPDAVARAEWEQLSDALG